jgi:uncharacterized membrane protein
MSILPQNDASWERYSFGVRDKIRIAKDFMYEKDKVRYTKVRDFEHWRSIYKNDQTSRRVNEVSLFIIIIILLLFFIIYLFIDNE